MKRKFFLLLFGLLIFSGVQAASTKLTAIRVYPSDTHRMVFDLSQQTSYTITTLHNPERLLIDFKNTQLALKLEKVPLSKTPIQAIRRGKNTGHNLRLILDLKAPVAMEHFALKANKDQPYRIVFDLTSPALNQTATKVPESTKPTAITAKPIILPPPLTETGKVATKSLSSQKLQDVIVLIDPGHGGQDPGASGQRGTHEKNVTLAIALDVRQNLQKIPGIKVYMTRERDVYPTLGQRLALARKVKADVYISIHADAYHNRAARGATVFALSQGRATSVGARWIAESENRSELLGGVNLTDKSYMLRSVLVDLSQTATISESLKLGSQVKTNLGKIGRLHANRVEQASLYVLTSPDIPSILVETGFISNLQEELLLNSPAYQQKLADAISRGIVNYLVDNPVPNTRFAG